MLVVTYNTSFSNLDSNDDFDKIEILSSYTETPDEFFLVPIAYFEESGNNSLAKRETKRKRIVFLVALVSGILFLASVVLVTVSLYLGKDIDEKVRNSNEMLRKHNDRMSEAYPDGSNATTIL